MGLRGAFIKQQELPEYDILRKKMAQKLQTQSEAEQQGFARRAIAQGMTGSGESEKQLRQLGESQAARMSESMGDIGFAEAQQIRAEREAERQRSFYGEESRLGREHEFGMLGKQQTFAGEQAGLGRAHETLMQERAINATDSLTRFTSTLDSDTKKYISDKGLEGAKYATDMQERVAKLDDETRRYGITVDKDVKLALAREQMKSTEFLANEQNMSQERTAQWHIGSQERMAEDVKKLKERELTMSAEQFEKTYDFQKEQEAVNAMSAWTANVINMMDASDSNPERAIAQLKWIKDSMNGVESAYPGGGKKKKEEPFYAEAWRKVTGKIT